jgi:hypothetical protein
MTQDHLLEVGDWILYENVVGAYLVPVDRVYKKKVEILMPGGYHLQLNRQTDGNMARLPKGEVTTFAICTVIPKITE